MNLPQNRTSLSVVILANRESDQLHRAICSVSDAEEIILAWTAKELPKKLSSDAKLKVLKLAPVTDFSQTRNEALAKVTQPWVFFLDSDEYVDEHFWMTLKPLLENSNCQGISLWRRDIFLGKVMRWGEVRNVRVLRIFQKKSGKYERAVHEVVRVDGKVKTDALLTLWHTPHSSVSSFWQKVRTYSEIEANTRAKKFAWVLCLESLFFPFGKFIQNFILRAGFLDGWRGLIYALLMSVHSVNVRVMMYEKK